MAYDQPEAAGGAVNRAVQAGLRISAYSLAWTVAAGSGAIAIGVIGNSLSLAVFGVIGLLDAVGSATLMLHFRHAIRHETISQRHERLTLLVVSAGMAAVGLATIADSVYRLDQHAKSSSLLAGIILAAVSVAVLATLSVGKRRIAARIPSHALRADGWLSAMGALLGGVALLGTTLNQAFKWWWMDPVAAIAVACGAVTLSVMLFRDAEPPGP
jgi:divalent metal cation (Fe/Co/Zn/Cd) transporter